MNSNHTMVGGINLGDDNRIVMRPDVIQHQIHRIDELEQTLKWVGLMVFTGHIPSQPIPRLIEDALEEYKRQHPNERVWP